MPPPRVGAVADVAELVSFYADAPDGVRVNMIFSADGAAAFADQENHRVAAGMIVHAGNERVTAFDAMDEPVVAQELERAIDRDRRRAGGVLEPFHDLVGAKRLMACEQRFQHLPPHRRQSLRSRRA